MNDSHGAKNPARAPGFVNAPPRGESALSAPGEHDTDLEHAIRERDAAQSALTALRIEHEVLQERASILAKQTNESDSIQERLTRLAGELREVHNLLRVTDNRVRFMHRELITDIQALAQLLIRYKPEARLPQVAGWALSPAGLLALVDIIEGRGAHTVVECGSGTSTLWIAYALKHMGRGRLIALEHLPEYADKTRSVLVEHGLTDFAEVRLAPLSPRSTPRGEFSWYSFDPTEIDDPVDVFLVDGPPQSTGRHARYPALPIFRDHLAVDAIIIADDTDRQDEQDMIEYWIEDEPRLHRLESPHVGIDILSLA